MPFKFKSDSYKGVVSGSVTGGTAVTGWGAPWGAVGVAHAGVAHGGIWGAAPWGAAVAAPWGTAHESVWGASLAGPVVGTAALAGLVAAPVVIAGPSGSISSGHGVAPLNARLGAHW
ncbi:uncharacterized protein LOC117178448 [Belonocnema kinseyi]|uniref:uncharacterized protein LOC117178448 n=1 Tax=Belonocnema kinseyi TaxID=2817044 RepID=UPI00143D2F1B|nr:uncharacterized protein LOC117178448 [Belonocnema kinseyi]